MRSAAFYLHRTASDDAHRKPNSTLINGKGRYSGGPSADLAVVNVEQGKRYRFRLVSISCDTYWTFSIDGHSFRCAVSRETIVMRPGMLFAFASATGWRGSRSVGATQAVAA